MSDTDFVQITATTDHVTGQALLYALTRAGYLWQYDFSKQRRDCATRGHRRIPAMTHLHPKPMPNWCPQVNPDEAWTARCVKEKIAADGKRHRCQKKVGHDDNVHTCKCGLEWKQW